MAFAQAGLNPPDMHRADPPRDQLVTSSDLVRRFGVWQDRAARAPVYVLHRGRPRFVLTSVETMQALCAPHASQRGADDLAALLDATDQMVLFADGDARLLTASRAAHRHFGDRLTTGMPLADLAPPPARALFEAALARVLATGRADEVELPSLAYPDRLLDARLEPSGAGMLVMMRDGSIESERRDALAAHDALATAIGAVPSIAVATINPRGHLERPAPSLMRLTGLGETALAGIRFVTLLEIGGRVAASEAIDQVLTNGAPCAIEAHLLVNRAAPHAITIGLAPRRAGLAIAGLTAVLTAHAG